MKTAWILLVLGVLTSCQKPFSQLSLQQLDTVSLDSSSLKVEVLLDSLVVPWDLEIDSEGYLWIAEQEGRVSRTNLETGESQLMLQIPEVWKVRTSGLLGMVSHPDFSQNHYLYVNYTAKQDSLITSKLVRYRMKQDSLIDPKVILEIEGGTSHNGSRLAFGPDKKLYWATGDKHDTTYAQNPKVLNGKILRLNPDGSIPDDNPDPNSPVWAMGFRNMQGLAFSSTGFLYTSEHGDAIEDEINLIQQGRNYGWPKIEGKHNLQAEQEFALKFSTLEPIRSWTPVIAPAGMAYYGSSEIPEWENTLLLTTLKAKSLRILFLSKDGKSIDQEKVLFENLYGRLRDVAVGPDGSIYLSTSNLDWNPQPGFPLSGDDKILKISKTELVSSNSLHPVTFQTETLMDGKTLYEKYCASCHQANGEGVPGSFPSLVKSPLVIGEPNTLAQVVLSGRKTSEASSGMPAFRFLDNREIAEILNYIRSNWNNASSSVSPDLIESQR